MHILILIVLLGGAASCQYLPVSKDPDAPNLGKNNPHNQNPSLPQPTLQSGEFLLKDTVLGQDGVLRFTVNQERAEGTLVALHETGQKRMAITYVGGLRQGTAEWWGVDGRLKHKRQYLQGKLNGVWVEYYAGSNSPRQEQLYDDGTEILRRGWWPNGNKQFEITFAHGKEISRITWEADGTLSNTTGIPATDSNSTPPIPLIPIAPESP